MVEHTVEARGTKVRFFHVTPSGMEISDQPPQIALVSQAAKGAACKADVFALRGFESLLTHK